MTSESLEELCYRLEYENELLKEAIRQGRASTKLSRHRCTCGHLRTETWPCKFCDPVLWRERFMVMRAARNKKELSNARV